LAVIIGLEQHGQSELPKIISALSPSGFFLGLA
jgi:hypothetical protein